MNLTPDGPSIAGGDAAESASRHWHTDLQHGQRWPYPRRVYVLRALWLLVQYTVWPLLPTRFHPRRTILLRLFGARCAWHVKIARSVKVQMPWDLSIGPFSSLGERVNLYNLGGLEIGDHTVISQDAYLCGGTHDYTDPTLPLVRKKIVIGPHVWIGAGAFVGPGVTIGQGAVIGARAVVVHDVAPWTVVAGNPARVIKQRIMRQV